MSETLNPMLLFMFSESPSGSIMTKPLLFCRPREVIEAHKIADVLPALKRVQEACAQGFYAAGFVTYEAAPAFDSAYQTAEPGELPLVWFGIFDQPEDRVLDLSGSGYRFDSDFVPSIDMAHYTERIHAIKEAIARGETYQVNFTFRLRAHFSGSSETLFHRCTEVFAPPFAAYLNIGRYSLVSLSPELFFRTDGRRVVTRPMKGTAARGRFAAEDKRHMSALRESEKNRAENVMIVDLLRNDIGRVAEVGSVQVESLFDVEVYPSALQMTSTVAGVLRPGATWLDVFSALFPCGSVTGAPKASTMAHIARLESEPRGVYCGAIGFIEPGEKAVFNVAIRTLTIDHKHNVAEYGTGGGITWDSDPAGEYCEALLKTRTITQPWPYFDLLETLRLQDGRYELLERHIARLLESANYFGFRVDQQRVRTALQRYAETHANGVWRVRLLAGPKGELKIEGQVLEEELFVGLPRPVSLATTPVDSRDPFLFHKTTRRQVYDRHRREHPDVFDTLLWNERGEITEFTTGNLVLEMGGKLYTPSRICGLLAGTLREELLESGRISEQIVLADDVYKATRLWFVNSVRGWIPVELKRHG